MIFNQSKLNSMLILQQFWYKPDITLILYIKMFLAIV